MKTMQHSVFFNRANDPLTPLSLGLASLITVSAWHANAQWPPHLEIGMELNQNMVTAYQMNLVEDDEGQPLNSYGGSWNDDTVVVIPGDFNNNILPFNRSRCGSFVTSLLHLAYPQWDGWWGHPFQDSFPGEDSIKIAPKTDWTESPKASEYMDLIQQSVGFLGPVVDFRDVCPGDLFVKRNANSSEGHVAIVVDIDWNHPFPYNGGLFYSMEILDSSMGYHTDDSREPFGVHGAGVGKVGVLVDQNYAPVAQCWSAPEGAENTWAAQLDTHLEYENDTLLMFGKLDIPEAMGACDLQPEPYGEDYLAPFPGTEGLEFIDNIQALNTGVRFITGQIEGAYLGHDTRAAILYPTKSRRSLSAHQNTVLVPWVGIDNRSNQTMTGGLHIDSNGVILGHTATLPQANPNRQPSKWLAEFHQLLESQNENPIVFYRTSR